MPIGKISSAILFHCWRDNDRPLARAILASICEKGLLLTSNATTLDSFAIDRGAGITAMEVMQHPRVCFTDIPMELLAEHGQRYGKYGIGFRRETVIDWGGAPAWYLPNHWDSDTMKIIGPSLVNGLHAAMLASEQLQALAAEFKNKGVPFTIRYEQGPALNAEQSASELQKVAGTIFMVLSFIKEMSPSTVEDFSYLHEREWRLVFGMGRVGPAAFRALTTAEKEALCATRTEWAKPRQSKDINITSRYGAAPLIDGFQYFNGLPGKETAAQLIDTILVPDSSEADWAETFVASHAAALRATKPKIVIFPAS